MECHELEHVEHGIMEAYRLYDKIVALLPLNVHDVERQIKYSADRFKSNEKIFDADTNHGCQKSPKSDCYIEYPA